jgi:hypothetical protein
MQASAGCCSDMNSRFVLSDLSAYRLAALGEGDHFFFADCPRDVRFTPKSGHR